MLSIEQLLQRFSKGFAVSPEGVIYEVIDAKKHVADLPEAEGYLALITPKRLPGDDVYGHAFEGWEILTPQAMAEHLDRLIKLADTIAEDEILSKLYKTYSERLDAAAKELLG